MLCSADVMLATVTVLGKRHHAFLHPTTICTCLFH